MKKLKEIFTNYPKTLLVYVLFLIWFFVAILINKFTPLSPLTIIIMFFGLLYSTGFSLRQIFKFDLKEDRLGKLVVALTFGLVFALIIAGVALTLALTIGVLTKIYLILAFLVILIGLFLDLRRKSEKEKIQFHMPNIWQSQNLGYFLVLIMIITTLVVVGITGTLLKGGDPDFHMAIMQKAFGGLSLKPSNLGFIKSDTLQIAYGLPVWHVFMTTLAVISHADVINLWSAISLPLSIFAFLVWAWLAQIIFKKRFFVWVVLAFLAIYVYNWANGYIFTCLPIPDTLNNMLILPLVISLALHYIFNPDRDQKWLWLIAVGAVLMAAIHLTQYVYFLMLIGMFGLVWVITQWRQEGYKSTLARIGWVLFWTCIIFLPFLAILELKSHAISKILLENAQDTRVGDLRFGTFAVYDTYSKYAYLASPLILLFIRKNRRLIFLFSLMLIAPLIYLKPVSAFVIKILGYIFLNRLFGSITWHYLVLALIFGFAVIMIDRLASLLKLGKIWKYLANLLVIVATVLFACFQWRQQVVAVIKNGKEVPKLLPISPIYNFIFSDASDVWLGKHFPSIFIPIVVLAIAVIVLQCLKPKTQEFFNLEEPKNGILTSCLLAVLLIIFFSTSYPNMINNWQQVAHTNFPIAPINESVFENNTIKSFGGPALADFVRTQIPQKSVWVTPGNTVYTFPVIFDQFIVAYPRTGKLNRYTHIYESSKTPEDKLVQVGISRPEYILLYSPAKQDQIYFDAYPQYYQKIYDNMAIIYRVLPQAYTDAAKLPQPVLN
jgi:hypothetical protein